MTGKRSFFITMLHDESLGLESQGDNNPQDELLTANGIPNADAIEEQAVSESEIEDEDDDAELTDDDAEEICDKQIEDEDDDAELTDDDAEEICDKLTQSIEDGILAFEVWYEGEFDKAVTVRSIQFDIHGSVTAIEYFGEDEAEEN